MPYPPGPITLPGESPWECEQCHETFDPFSGDAESHEGPEGICRYCDEDNVATSCTICDYPIEDGEEVLESDTIIPRYPTLKGLLMHQECWDRSQERLLEEAECLLETP